MDTLKWVTGVNHSKFVLFWRMSRMFYIFQFLRNSIGFGRIKKRPKQRKYVFTHTPHFVHRRLFPWKFYFKWFISLVYHNRTHNTFTNIIMYTIWLDKLNALTQRIFLEKTKKFLYMPKWSGNIYKKKKLKQTKKKKRTKKKKNYKKIKTFDNITK